MPAAWALPMHGPTLEPAESAFVAYPMLEELRGDLSEYAVFVPIARLSVLLRFNFKQLMQSGQAGRFCHPIPQVPFGFFLPTLAS